VARTVRVEFWLPPRVTLDGFKARFNPAGDADEVRATVPVNPLSAEIVRIEVPDCPTATDTVIGLAVIVKSWMLKVAVAE
jgi:hypothetical protein